MSLKGIYKIFEGEAKFWLDELEKYNDTPFVSQSPDNQWTMSKLYAYLTSSCIDFYHKKISEQLTNSSEANSKKGKSFLGLVTFSQKKLTTNSIKKFNADFTNFDDFKDVKEARGKVIQSMKLMLNLSKELEGKENIKLKHDQFGWLKLKEWYMLPAWHLRYSESTKGKIDDFIISRKGVDKGQEADLYS